MMRESRVDNIEHVNWRGPASARWLSYLIITSHCHIPQSRLETCSQPFAHLLAVKSRELISLAAEHGFATRQPSAQW